MKIIISPYEAYLLSKYSSKQLEKILTLLNNYRRRDLTLDEYKKEVDKIDKLMEV